jgi:hypothetical protein
MLTARLIGRLGLASLPALAPSAIPFAVRLVRTFVLGRHNDSSTP